MENNVNTGRQAKSERQSTLAYGNTEQANAVDHANAGVKSHRSSSVDFSSPQRPQDSPSTRTGPPRSFSYSLNRPRNMSMEPARSIGDVGGEYEGEVEETPPPGMGRTNSDFRGALEYNDPEQREREREAAEKRERHRLNRITEDTWLNPLKWLNMPGVDPNLPTQESPKDDGEGWTSYFDFLKPGDKEKGKGKETGTNDDDEQASGGEAEKNGKREEDLHVQVKKRRSTMGNPQRAVSHDNDTSEHQQTVKITGLSRTRSLPQMKRTASRRSSTSKLAPRWGRLRSLLPVIAQQGKEDAREGQTAVPQNIVNITDELITGGLSTLMLKLWFERDEHGNRRIPALFHRLRVRISDSLHPLSGNKAVFRIECEYANGAARWVVYRQLRDFISLHRHYRFSNAYNRNVDALPEFPWSSLPYFKFLKKEGHARDRDLRRNEFVVMQRQALENYLIGLIRAVMFHHTANRLAGFLEISALFIHLAQSGGWQAKAGMLRIEPASSKSGGFGRKSASWSQKKRHRWCAVRDSYLVAVEEPGELKVWDVFVLDSDFKIERPKRVYRQGLNWLHGGSVRYEIENIAPGRSGQAVQLHHEEFENQGTIGKLKTKIRKTLRLGHLHDRTEYEYDNENAEGHSQDRHSTTVASLARARQRSNSTSSISSGESSTSSMAGRHTPIVDPSTHVNPMSLGSDPDESEREATRKKRRRRNKDVSKHTFYITNSQMRLKLFAKNERQMEQWITGLEKTAYSSHWTGSNRFGSFAPIRLNVAAQWLVDGRDYMWNLSRAILLARECIYIHDWWLSPELQMRRPNKSRYRLDRLLERKAREGVKIYVILYQEVSSRTTPTDSNYTKQRLVSLHPNIMVQRSPSHFQTGTFYWAHHEKLCVIDEAIAFMGGIDLCFGRWDTPQHILVDDPEPSGDELSQIWPGKDYSNPRISDFFTLNRPYDDMYDRSRIPRMPWHDVGMNVVGQPARDLCRHFVQRWNYLLRIKNHSRTMPFLLPPPEFKLHDLQNQGLTGTCEMQICRSTGPWSMGTPFKTESSIQNAYLKAIQLSEHFVYIENQFFITSTVVNDTVIENKIGDAIVHRIIRAHREGTKWRACIIIPLLPGFPYPIDHSDASALRIILECQNRTISRGPDSIFSRLRKEGIDPDEYISVFSLRNWAKFPGNVLTTEMVYIHGKVCVVDDRLAIIGSANINERSQRGDRDSELAAVIRDTDMIDGVMDGKPFKVGRFAHTLRVRLMREHLGVDVDAMYEEDLMSSEPTKENVDQDTWDPNHEQHRGQEHDITKFGQEKRKTAMNEAVEEAMDSARQAVHVAVDVADIDTVHYMQKMGLETKGAIGSKNDKRLEEERQVFSRTGQKVPGFASAVVPTLEEKTIFEHRPRPEQAKGFRPIMDITEENDAESHSYKGPPEAKVHDGSGELFGAPADASKNVQTDDEPPHARSAQIDATEEEKAAIRAREIIRKHLSAKFGAAPWTLPTPTPDVDPYGFEDPISDKFWKNVWVACAVHNTEIYRKVFHAVPDDTVTTWKQYKEFVLHHERLNKPLKDQSNPEPVGRVPSESGDQDAIGQDLGAVSKVDTTPQGLHKLASFDGEDSTESKKHQSSNGSHVQEEAKRVPSRADEPFDLWEREEMERLLGEVRGHLVLYPTRFLEDEDVANNFLFNADRLLPMPIYD